MSIKRYDIYVDFAGSLFTDPKPDGPWVKYDDHVAEVERLTALASQAAEDRYKLAGELVAARAERDEARAQVEGLAKALREIARHNPVMMLPTHSEREMVAIAEAALAALPTPPEEADRE